MVKFSSKDLFAYEKEMAVKTNARWGGFARPA